MKHPTRHSSWPLVALTFFIANLGIAAPSPTLSPNPSPSPTAAASLPIADDDDNDDDDESGSETAATDPEAEAAQASSAPVDEILRYTADLPPEELERRFQQDLPSLGSISVGFADAGRLINAVHMPEEDAWQLVVPENAWGTQETIDFLSIAARSVKEMFPEMAPLRINHIGKKDGGYLRPHRSHQSGRDVDLGFFYKDNANPGAIRGDRTRMIDPAPNWQLLRTIVTQTDVQLILVDKKIQQVLYEYALAKGEERSWLDGLFRAGKASIFQHARRHRDHFHVRFFAARSQELGRRVQPLLAHRPDQNLVIYRVHNGDTLGKIARHYASSVQLIQKANRMRTTFLHVGNTLAVPMRGACTQCPQPAPVVLPPRRLPPSVITAAIEVSPRIQPSDEGRASGGVATQQASHSATVR